MKPVKSSYIYPLLLGTLIIFSLMIGVPTQAQNQKSNSFNIGDPAPPLKVQEWIRGMPVHSFEKGKVYVVDCWATWCKPCVASIPYASALAGKFKGEVTFLAIAVYENGYHGDPVASSAQIKEFVDSMGNQMDFPVAVDDSSFMSNHWVEASGQYSIPCAFVINAQGKVAWIGNPASLDSMVLSEIVNNTWDLKAASAKRTYMMHIDELDEKAGDFLNSLSYDNKGHFQSELEKEDSILLAIKGIVKKEPELKYTSMMAIHTFRALLKTNLQEAYEYGKKALVASNDRESVSSTIIYNIEHASHTGKLPPKMYNLCAETYQAEIDNTDPIYRKLLDSSEIYHKMAAWYLLAGDTLEAKEAERKSFNTIIVQMLRTKNDSNAATLALITPYSMGDSTALFPSITDTINDRERVYKVYLENPATFMVGETNPSFMLVKPGDSVVFEETHTHHNTLDSGVNFTIVNNSGLKLPNLYTDSIIYNLSPDLLYDSYFTGNGLTDSTFTSWLAKAFSIDEINKISLAATDLYLSKTSHYSELTDKKAYLINWYAQMIFRHNEHILNSKYNTILSNNPALLKNTEAHILKLAVDIDQQDGIKTVHYWRALKSIYNGLLSKIAKPNNYNVDSINKTLSLFNDTTRQFILLSMIGDSSSFLIYHNLAWTAIAAKIDLKIFQPYLKNYLSKKLATGPEYLNIALRSAGLYDTAMQEITLDSMFRSTKQPYLLFNFCGSWSVSSMKGIAAYSADPKLNNNDSLRLVWLFFENDSTDWLKVINKYNLPAEDCFFVKSYLTLTQNFASQFNWANDFPHYFLFNREGKCINENAASFSKFDVGNLITNQGIGQLKEYSHQ